MGDFDWVLHSKVTGKKVSGYGVNFRFLEFSPKLVEVQIFPTWKFQGALVGYLCELEFYYIIRILQHVTFLYYIKLFNFYFHFLYVTLDTCILYIYVCSYM